MSYAESRIDPYQAVTDLILEHLERGVVPWRCPWQHEVGIPRNFHTGKTYNGINVLLLGLRRMPSPYWLTFRQAQERGGHVRKGEHGTHIIKVGESKSSEDEGPDDSPEPERKRQYLRAYTVFNATQIEGIEFPETPGIPLLDRLSKILSLCSDGGAASLAASGACLLFPNSTRRTFLAIEAAALADSKGHSFREPV